MDDKAFNLLEKMYNEFAEFRGETNARFDKVESDISGLKKQVSTMEFDISGLKKQVSTMEFDLKKDISALYDGYTQNTQQLNRIENAVLKHEDIIIKKIK